ncbi:hypothetical protein GJ744_010202 [Endocarpon pusillum]|uniref:Uncharacterized protein n=1 Tax=Endocarpon pusillum TaxID=364733 RepID=A0A8H7AHR1_9EURO|nr:hypothetical protein GJ744_010202 [Endocarpon pusillum]
MNSNTYSTLFRPKPPIPPPPQPPSASTILWTNEVEDWIWGVGVSPSPEKGVKNQLRCRKAKHQPTLQRQTETKTTLDDASAASAEPEEEEERSSTGGESSHRRRNSRPLKELLIRMGVW